MRVLLDLRCLETFSGTRGIGRYARELARALRTAAPPGWSLAGLSWSGLGPTLGIEDVRCRSPRRGISVTDRPGVTPSGDALEHGLPFRLGE